MQGPKKKLFGNKLFIGRWLKSSNTFKKVEPKSKSLVYGHVIISQRDCQFDVAIKWQNY